MKRIAVTIFIVLMMVVPDLPSIEEVDYIIEEITFALEIHQWYIDNNYHRKYTGEVEWHQQWVDTYNRTLEILFAYRHLIRLLSLDPRAQVWVLSLPKTKPT